MAKSNYFSHDSNARNSQKLIRLRQAHGSAGYGIYFMVLERLRDEESYKSAADYEMIAYDLHEEPGLVKSVIEDFGLFDFSEDMKYFWSHGLQERMDLKDSRKSAGRKGAESRWSDTPSRMAQNGKNMAKNDLPCESEILPLANIYERKEKERKEKENNSSSLPSPLLAQTEEELLKDEEDKLLFDFFFIKNFHNPKGEVDNLLDFYNREGRCWDKMTQQQKRKAVENWREIPEKPPRLDSGFLELWKKIVCSLALPPELFRLFLSKDVGYSTAKGNLIIYCDPLVSETIERNLDRFRSDMLAFRDKNNCNKIYYKTK